MDESAAIFTSTQTARLSGVSPTRLAQWYRKGLVTPRYVDDGWLGVKYLYSFRDLVMLRTLLLLRETYNVSLQQLQQVNQFFQNHYEDPWTTLTLYVLDREVLFDEPTMWARMSGARPGQRVLSIDLAPIIGESHEDMALFQIRTSDEIGHLETRKRRLYIAGTRIPADAVWEYLDAGYGEEDILRSYPTLTPSDIRAAYSQRLPYAPIRFSLSAGGDRAADAVDG